MYTELSLWFAFKDETPEYVISMVKDLVNWDDNETSMSHRNPIRWWNAYFWFAAVEPKLELFLDRYYKISSRCSIKNYEWEIEELLKILEPWVSYWSWVNNMWAMTMYEEDSEPTIYYLDEPLHQNQWWYYRISAKWVYKTWNKIMLVKKKWKWHLPWWWIDYWETWYEAVKREVLEEMWLHCLVCDRYPHFFTTYISDSWINYANVFYSIWIDAKKYTPSKECEEIVFMTNKEILDCPIVYRPINDLALYYLNN